MNSVHLHSPFYFCGSGIQTACTADESWLLCASTASAGKHLKCRGEITLADVVSGGCCWLGALQGNQL